MLPNPFPVVLEFEVARNANHRARGAKQIAAFGRNGDKFVSDRDGRHQPRAGETWLCRAHTQIGRIKRRGHRDGRLILVVLEARLTAKTKTLVFSYDEDEWVRLGAVKDDCFHRISDVTPPFWRRAGEFVCRAVLDLEGCGDDEEPQPRRIGFDEENRPIFLVVPERPSEEEARILWAARVAKSNEPHRQARLRAVKDRIPVEDAVARICLGGSLFNGVITAGPETKSA
ncbi:MAG: hypothetical protein U9M92_02105 [Patescibacteria group bacterium]|nr:hypothetical protein [Patescibacteria group bacterium]